MILRVINSVKKSKEITKIIIATSKNKSDDNLVNFLKKNNSIVFRGELSNVAKRLHDAATKYKAKNFVRISGDSPIIDFKIIDKAVRLFKKNSKFDIITNVFPRTFSSGQSVEVIKTKILNENLLNMTPLEKEHVSKYFYNNNREFLIKNFKKNSLKKNEKHSVDNKNDIKIIMKILNKWLELV